jgi:DNA-binding MarR family transcriptional regulator
VPSENSSTLALADSDNTRGETPLGEVNALAYQLLRFVKLVKREDAGHTRPTDGVERAAYLLLAVLITEGPQRTTALAEAVHSDTSTVSRQVGALVRHGLVERQADPADGRACLLAATPRGRDCFDRHRRARVHQLSRVVAQWSPEDLQTFVTLFERLNTDVERAQLEHNNGAENSPAPKGEQ